MNYTLKKFATDCRGSLKNKLGIEGRKEVLKLVKRATCDNNLIAECFPIGVTDERRVLFEDTELGFCICCHVYNNKKKGLPHDHGPTWAIYGQVSGQTEMTDWEKVDPKKQSEPTKVKISRTYKLAPGDAHLYEIGDIHAASCESAGQVIRIEGQNTDYISRTLIKPA